jgi:tetratricopeptide (TPR) repeat protein
MSAGFDRIDNFRKMANDDPDNELAHFSLGKVLLESDRFEEAITSLERTIALNPQFSKAYQLLGKARVNLGHREQALAMLREGFAVADQRGDLSPRDEMARMIRDLGETPPEPRKISEGPTAPGDGFQCRRPGCRMGTNARRLTSAPFKNDLGQMILERVCHDCWRDCLANGVKIINEFHLELSRPAAQQIYEQKMREFLGFF